MAFYSFLTLPFKKKKAEPQAEPSPQLTIPQLMNELGLRGDGVIGSYNEEEKPDHRSIDSYIQMQENDGTVRAITRLFSMPIQSTPIKILPGEKDKGERDFIESVFLNTQKEGGMTTPLPFIIADMTRAIFEGYRAYEKVPKIITDGKYKGKIGWKKLAQRDAKTIDVRVDRNGGFMGIHQKATFGDRTVDVNIPPEKTILFTFQKERHPFYGESILKTAWYHYDKKHKLYYLAHKKAEIDAIGLKILKLQKPMSGPDVVAAENAVDDIGVNTRVTLPSGFELEINRASSGYDVMGLIEHHDTQMVLSTLAQAIQFGTKQKYAYTYGSGITNQNEFITMMLQSIMKNIEDTLNEWAVAPLIDWNFKNPSYPKIKLQPLKSSTEEYLLHIFQAIVTKDPSLLTAEYVATLSNNVAEYLGLEVKVDTEDIALKAFENGKKQEADKLKKPAPKTDKELKEEIAVKAIKIKDDPYFTEKFEALGRNYAIKMLSE